MPATCRKLPKGWSPMGAALTLTLVAQSMMSTCSGCQLGSKFFSLGTNSTDGPRPLFRDHIDTTSIFSMPGVSANATAFAAVTSASLSLASPLGILGVRIPQSIPSTSSNAIPKLILSTLRRTVRMAASFMRLAKEAADHPCVTSATFVSTVSSSSFLLREWYLRISSRATGPGLGISYTFSKRPGRRRAWSSSSARLVAPMVSTCSSLPWMPSICTSIANSALSRSMEPGSPPKVDRARPMASISSMKMMAGARFRAVTNRLLTRAAAMPANISTNSEPTELKNVTPASPAIARAK
mmetsp:Transcript_17472/g.48558  ORF Transcript_17472/g.48558 Transcript_17472/m.48558 type:complete len:297 (+) Transcript_17472:1564-2454(+)